MTNAGERNYPVTRVIAPSLFIGGIVAALLGIATLAFSRSEVVVGLSLLFGGIGAIAMAQLLELLMDIASHLAAMRAQMGRGVLGILG